MIEDRTDMPLVSVVIPAYNSEAYIARSIQSALDQDYPNKEILVIDDGSTDGTAEVVQAFGDPVRYFYQKNSGPDKARNLGIETSRAEFIAFLDSDDEWLPGRLTRTVMPMLADEGVGLTYCRSLACFPDGSEEFYGAIAEGGRIFPRVFWPPITHSTPATTCRRSVLLKVGCFDRPLIAFEDHDLWIRMEEHSRTVFVDEPLVRVHVREDSLSRIQSMDAVCDCYFQIITDALSRRPDLYEEHRKTMLADAHLSWGVRYCACGERLKGTRHFLKSLGQAVKIPGLILMLKALGRGEK